MISAIVLAGGKKSGIIQREEVPVNEALIAIGERYMIQYVVDALLSSSYISDVVIAGPVDKLQGIYHLNERVVIVEGGESAIASLSKALEKIEATSQILIATADIPLLTAEAVDHFIRCCVTLEGDLFYPIVSKGVNEGKYPGVTRTYVYLKEGVFTGGNIFLLNSQVVRGCLPIAEDLVSLRKKPFSLASYVGWKLLIRYMLGMLSIQDAEEGVSKLLGIKGVGIISPYPEIGIDVDKESDYLLVKQVLLQRHVS